MKAQLLIPAAGFGQRLGREGPKALADVAGAPLIVRTLARFAPLGLLDNAVVLVPPSHQDAFAGTLYRAYPDAGFSIIEGGAERQDSVQRGLDGLAADTEIVVIHDAARPFVTCDSVQASIDAAATVGAATVAIPSADTILEGDAEGFLQQTPDRQRLWACQTPQTFRVEVIREAHGRARAEDFYGTDDASLVRRMGRPVKLVPGTPLNFKVTTPADLALAELVVREDLA